MAIVVGDPGKFPGGWREFRFLHRITLRWCDGQERVLEAGVDYPEDMPFEILAKRLKVMTTRQQGTLKIWRDSQDKVHVIMTKDQW